MAELGWSWADLAAMLTLGALWAFMVGTARPYGEFPVGDDWAYATPVVDVLRHHRLTAHPFTPAVSFSHVVIGATVSAIFGFSFQVLRATMFGVGLVGVLGTYVLVRLMAPSVILAVIGAVTVAANPIYFLLSGSFMTDVSFYAMAVVSLCGFVRALQVDSQAAFWTGTVASCCAALNRQIGLAIPLAFAVVEIALRRPVRPRRAFAPLLLALSALGLWQATVPTIGATSLFSNLKANEVSSFLSGPLLDVATRLLTNALIWLIYAGLLTLPALLVTRTRGVASDARIALSAAVLLGLWIAFVGRSMPILPPVGNFLTPAGIGPLTLRDTMILQLNQVPQLPLIARLALSAASLCGAAWLVHITWTSVTLVFTSLQSASRRAIALLILVGLQWTAASVSSFFFDRYLLPLLMVVVGLVAAVRSSQAPTDDALRLRDAGVVLMLQVLVSIAGAHDYFAWNRARLDALTWLTTTRGLPITQIDAGFEWSGWYLYDPNYQKNVNTSWWWIHNDDWIITMGQIPERTEVRRWDYPRWSPPWGNGSVIVVGPRLTDHLDEGLLLP